MLGERREAARTTGGCPVTMSANQSQSTDEEVAAPMTQLDYVDRMLEPRESGLDSAAALLSGLACGLGVVALWFAPMVIGFFAIGFAIIGLAISGDRNRIGKIALIIATVGWLVGSILAVFTGNSPISINLA